VAHIKITSPFAFLFDKNNKINKQKLLKIVVQKTKTKFIGSKQQRNIRGGKGQT